MRAFSYFAATCDNRGMFAFAKLPCPLAGAQKGFVRKVTRISTERLATPWSSMRILESSQGFTPRSASTPGSTGAMR